ncbi:MAG: UbiA prenyltransferase family protein [Candidatus Thorarchaeota archaeon]|nr:UbiA prenyltransferase family protein [Candidatus Thorarchaeota archaeon]
MAASDFIRLMRPAQWYKNLLVFLAIVFYQVPQVYPWIETPPILDFTRFYSLHLPLILGFLAFCAVSSATYILNDIQDLEADAAHPEKRNRPLPSGAIQRSTAKLFAVILLAGGLFLSFILYWIFFILVILYIITSQLYNAYLRKWAIIDVVTIAVGFVIRAISGAVLLRIPFTSWLVIGVFFFALVLGFGKRKNELQYLGKDAVTHKPVFTQYTDTILDHGISMSATWFVIFYTLYCYNNFAERMEQQPVMLTVPILAGLILRYVYLIHIGSPVGRKPHLAIKDKGIFIGGILFLLVLAWTLFFWEMVLDFVGSLFQIALDYLETLFPPLFP